MKLVIASLLCLTGALAWYVETCVELAHRDVAHADELRGPPPVVSDRSRSTQVPRALHVTTAAFGGAHASAAVSLADEDAPAILRGTVVDARGQRLPAAWVEVRIAGCEDCEPAEVLMEPDGRFSAEVTPGTWELIARADGAIATIEQGVAIAAGETIDGIVLALEEGRTIRGRVFAEDEPTDGATVYLEGHGYRLTTFVEDGEFEFASLPPGRYHLSAWMQGMGGDAIDGDTGESVTLTLRSGQVHGVVIDPSGQPAAGAQLVLDVKPTWSAGEDHDPWGTLPAAAELYDPCFYGGCEMALSDESGAFELDVPFAASVRVDVWDMEGRRAVLENLSPHARQLTVRLHDPHETRVRVVALDPGLEGPFEAYLSDARPSRSRPAPQQVLSEDGIATLYTFEGIPVNVEVPPGTRVEPIDPLPPEVRFVAPQDDEVDQLRPIHLVRNLDVEL